MPANHRDSTQSQNESSKTPLSVVKFLELVSESQLANLDSKFVPFKCLAVACCYFHFYSFSDDDLVTEFIATGTFCGYCIILTAVMAGDYRKVLSSFV